VLVTILNHYISVVNIDFTIFYKYTNPSISLPDIFIAYSKMDKGTKDKLIRSPGENGGG
jgi:hypothetical protein